MAEISIPGVSDKYKTNDYIEALMKKEIIAFDEKDNPFIIDPLFQYWVRKYYFEMSE